MAHTSDSMQGVVVALGSSFHGCFAHAGFLAALHEADVFPAQLAGSSAGALAAVVCGAGFQGPRLETFFMQPGFRRAFLDLGLLWRLPGVLTNLYGSGVLSGGNMVQFLRRRLRTLQLEDCHGPKVQISVTNVTRRKTAMIQAGDAAQWAVASCAIPGIFQHQRIHGDLWCDGGVAAPVPFDHWLEDPAVHTIVLHQITHPSRVRRDALRQTFTSSLGACYRTVCRETTELRLRLARQAGKRVINVITQAPRPRLFPTWERQALLSAGRESGQRVADQI